MRQLWLFDTGRVRVVAEPRHTPIAKKDSGADRKLPLFDIGESIFGIPYWINTVQRLEPVWTFTPVTQQSLYESFQRLNEAAAQMREAERLHEEQRTEEERQAREAFGLRHYVLSSNYSWT